MCLIPCLNNNTMQCQSVENGREKWQLIIMTLGLIIIIMVTEMYISHNIFLFSIHRGLY